MSTFREEFEALRSVESLRSLFDRVLFVEQPIRRDNALGTECHDVLRTWSGRPPIIIDEADGELGSFRSALEVGYDGVSHKKCKGIFKSLANAALCRRFSARRNGPEELTGRKMVDGSAGVGTPFITGKDLANVGPIALAQDLVVASTLGLNHVERNGHHYFAGLSAYSPAAQEQIVSFDSDLYENGTDFVLVRVREGTVSLSSALSAPFGFAGDPPLSECVPLDQWDFSQLEHT